MIFTIIVKESTESSPLFALSEELRRGGGFSPAVRQRNAAAPFSGESGGDFSGRRRRLSGCAFFSAGAQRGGFCVGVAAGFAQAKKSAERLIFFFIVYFFNAAKGFGLYSPVEGMNPVRL